MRSLGGNTTGGRIVSLLEYSRFAIAFVFMPTEYIHVPIHVVFNKVRVLGILLVVLLICESEFIL